MARPRKPKNEPEVEKAAASRRKGPPPTPPPDLKVVAGTGHGSNEGLTDSEQQALFFQHRKAYLAADAAKKKADAEIKNVGKRLKADLGEHGLMQIKLAIRLAEDDGSAKLQERIEKEIQVARWLGLPVGSQASLFDPDRRTAEEVADLEGFSAGAGGEWMKIPEKYGASSPAGQAWAKGWHRGQEAIFNIKEKKGESAPLLRSASVTPTPDGPAPEVTDGDEGSDDGSSKDDDTVH